jgi:hypothetical protein
LANLKSWDAGRRLTLVSAVSIHEGGAHDVTIKDTRSAAADE